jgi:hypothetical protein
MIKRAAQLNSKFYTGKQKFLWRFLYFVIDLK